MSESVNRREFGMKLAIGAASVPLTAELVHSAEAKQPGPPSEAELLLEVVKQRYANEHLTDEVQQQIRGSIGGHIGRGRSLSAFPLTNADEPGFVFRAYRAD